MRRFAIFAFEAVTVMALAGCSENGYENLSDGAAASASKPMLAITAGNCTRTSISDDLQTIKWANGDAVGLFYNTNEIKAEFSMNGKLLTNGDLQNIKYALTGGAGAVKGSFGYQYDAANEHPSSVMSYTGNYYWQSGVSAATLYAYYPYTFNAECGHPYSAGVVPFTLPRTQEGSMAAVASNDLAWASATVNKGGEAYVTGEANFSFEHLFSVVEFTVKNSTSSPLTIDKVMLTAAEGTAVTGDCVVNFFNTADLSTKGLNMGKTATSSGVAAGSVNCDVIVKPSSLTIAAGGSAKLYAVVAPCALSNATVKVITTGGYKSFAVTSATFAAGKYYTKRLDVTSLTPNPAVHSIDFEDVTLGNEAYGGFYNSTYTNILTGKGVDKGSDWSETSSSEWTDYIYSTTDAKFIGYYAPWGGTYPTWGGFAFSSNVKSSFSSTLDYTYQFHAVTASTEANKFSVLYDIESTGMLAVTMDSAIDFTSDVTPVSADVANDDLMGTYMATDPTVTFTGYIKSVKTKAVTQSLKNIAEWTTVDLSALGKVNKIIVTMGGDVYSTPFYVCIDNIKYTKE